MSGPKQILIAGGGAGGLELAIRLARATGRGEKAKVTLVDPSPTHLWKPRLHEIAVGLLVAADEQAPYSEQGAAHGFDFVLGTVTSIDVPTSTATVGAVAKPDGSGELLPERSLPFDQAVVAIGSTINDFGIDGVHEHCHALDTAGGAERLHGAIMAQAARVSAGYAEKLRIAIVGAGTTGVEFAADLRSASGDLSRYRSLLKPEQMEITLVEAGPKPLAALGDAASDNARRLLDKEKIDTRFNADVSKVEAGVLHLKNGDTVSADILVWASGVRGRSIELNPKPKMEKGGRMLVDQTLRLINAGGNPVDRLFALGDCAACFEKGDKKPVAATAQAAQQQGTLLARSLAAQLAGEPALPFHYRYRGTLVSFGPKAAIGNVAADGRKFRVAGIAARLSYRLLYREHLVTLFGLPRTAAMTIADALRHSTQPRVKLEW